MSGISLIQTISSADRQINSALRLLRPHSDLHFLHSEALQAKSSRTTQGVAVLKMKPKYKLERVASVDESGLQDRKRYKAKVLPAAGALLRPEDRGETQTSLLGD